MEYYYGNKEPQNKELIWVIPKTKGRCSALKYGSQGWKPVANIDAIDDIYQKINQIDITLSGTLSFINMLWWMQQKIF